MHHSVLIKRSKPYPSALLCSTVVVAAARFALVLAGNGWNKVACPLAWLSQVNRLSTTPSTSPEQCYYRYYRWWATAIGGCAPRATAAVMIIPLWSHFGMIVPASGWRGAWQLATGRRSEEPHGCGPARRAVTLAVKRGLDINIWLCNNLSRGCCRDPTTEQIEASSTIHTEQIEASSTIHAAQCASITSSGRHVIVDTLRLSAQAPRSKAHFRERSHQAGAMRRQN